VRLAFHGIHSRKMIPEILTSGGILADAPYMNYAMSKREGKRYVYFTTAGYLWDGDVFAIFALPRGSRPDEALCTPGVRTRAWKHPGPRIKPLAIIERELAERMCFRPNG